MKKLLFVISLFAVVAMAQAQETIFNCSDNGANNIVFAGAATDTVGTTNGGQLTLYKVVNAKALTAPVYLSYTVSLTRISGDVAGHILQFQGSCDGTNYTNIDSDTLANAASVVYSFTTQDTVAYVYPFFRWLLTSDGTGIEKLSAINGKVVLKK